MGAAGGAGRLASVIVPCFDQLEFTRLCVPALFRQTRRPWELIVVDNGSADGTAQYLAGVRDAAPVRVEVITNPSNRGFPAACNQGLRAARGDYLVLLNNDAVVTHDWLDQLAALAESDPKVGLTGPVSNYAAPPQLVEQVPYADLEAMDRFAAHWGEAHRGQWFAASKLSGFCLLLKRSVLEALGGFDERFGLGFFDDDDLALRARRAGFTLAVAHDLFVHHFGSRTFTGAGIDAEALLAENQAKFRAKWGDSEPAGRRVELRPWSAPAPPARSNGTRPRVSLTMIVRNEEANLPACLASAQGLFDEVVVVDTGSTDRTAEIARSFGARVFDFVWVDDFAAARNAALARARGDYAFWLDADDVLDPPERQKLKAVLDRLGDDGEAAYVVRCACDPDSSGGGGATVVDHIRLFPVREDVRWSYRVHEQILPALRVAGVPVKWTDVVVRHTGYTDRALRRRKLERDEGILRGELEERPDDPFVLFNLGSIAIELQDWSVALGHLEKSLAGSAPTDSITRKLYALIARCHQMTGDPARALETCAAGLAVDPDDAELHFREAVVRRNHGDPAGAERCWRRVLTLSRPERFASVDPGIYGHLTRRNLAALAEERGDGGEARQLWADVQVECPGDPEALTALERLSRPAPVEVAERSGPPLHSRADFGELLNRLGLTGTGAEVGVENGFFARRVLDQWRGRLLYLVDVWQPMDDYWDVTNAPEREQVLRLHRAVENVAPHWGRVRIVQERSENAARLVPDAALDWVYLDANHEYGHVLRDLELWAPKVRPGGLIAGHDFLDEERHILGVRTVYGVKRAVHEFFPGRRVETTDEEFPTWFVTNDAR